MEFKTTSKNGREITLDYAMPTSIDEAVERYTAEVCLDVLTAQAKIRMQNYVRGLLVATSEDGSDKYTEERIAEKFASWKLTGGNRNVQSKFTKLKGMLGDMDDDKADAIIEQYLAERKAKRESEYEVDEEESEEDEVAF